MPARNRDTVRRLSMTTLTAHARTARLVKPLSLVGLSAIVYRLAHRSRPAEPFVVDTDPSVVTIIDADEFVAAQADHRLRRDAELADAYVASFDSRNRPGIPA